MEFANFCRAEMRAQSRTICRAWLDRITEILTVDQHEVFPSLALLDHIPDIVEELADYLAPENGAEVVTASAVTEKAREIGNLRFEQDATTHQILSEYDLLAVVMDEFLVECLESADQEPTSAQIHEVASRLHRCIRVLTQASVDAFSARNAKQVEEQRDLLRSFNLMIGHEIRGPMGTIDLVAGLLSEETISTENHTRLTGLLTTSVEKVVEMVGNLESLSRLDDDTTQSPTRQLVDLGGLAEEVARNLAGMAEARGVQVRIADNLPTFESVLYRLEMILVNLVANAIKYSDPTRDASFVAVDVVGEAPDRVVLRIKDNGIGIPKDKQEAVFGRFYRGHRERDGELGARGSGLGLSIVSECVRSLEGHVELSSEEGVGTEFIVTLPTHS